MFKEEGDCLAAKLSPDNVYSTEGWKELSLPEIARQQAQAKEEAFRGDAAFARPGIYETHEARQVKYAIRLSASANVERTIARSSGRPRHKLAIRYKTFLYQAANWTRARWVLATFKSGTLYRAAGELALQIGPGGRRIWPSGPPHDPYGRFVPPRNRPRPARSTVLCISTHQRAKSAN